MAKRERRRRHERRRQHAEQQEGSGGLTLRRSVITGVGVAAGATLGLASPAFGAAQNYYVNQSGDAGDGTCDQTCTLRDAIDDANANTGYADFVLFSGVTGNIALTNGQIPITDSVNIFGPGADQLTVTAQANNRVFDIGTSGGRVFMYGLTLAGNGTVTGDGGLIRNLNNELDIQASVLSGATASGKGGAIYDDGGYAGGVYNSLAYSTVSGNHAAYGGGTYALHSGGYLGSDTFSGNTAAQRGGATDIGYGPIISTTLSGNSTAGAAGGAYIYNYVYAYNSIFANNTGGSIPDFDPGGGYAGWDLVENTGGLSLPATIITGQDPQLGSLTNNGGRTPTLKPGAGSPVVDQGLSYADYDQRYAPPFLRTIDNPNKANASGGNGSDIGAIELSVAEGPQPPVVTPAPAPHKKKKCKKKKKRSAAQVAKKKCKKKKKRSAPFAQVGSLRQRSARQPELGRFRGVGRSGHLAWPNGPRHRAFELRGR